MPLLDLSQMKVRSAMQTFLLGPEPEKLFSYEPDRLVVILYLDDGQPGWFAPARTFDALKPLLTVQAGYTMPLELYGPQEIWLTGTTGGSFVVCGGYWQAIYRA